MYSSSNISNIDLQLIFRGNSLFRSFHDNGIEQYMPKLVKASIENEVKSLDFHSYGVGGERADTINNNFNTLIAPLVDKTKFTVLFLTEDANYIGGGGASGQANINQLNETIIKAFASGVDKVALMVGWNVRPPYNTNWSSAAARQRKQDYYALVENGAIDSRVYLFDMRIDSIVGGGENQNQNDYFFDHIHLSTIGWNRLADEYVTPLIRQICY